MCVGEWVVRAACASLYKGLQASCMNTDDCNSRQVLFKFIDSFIGELSDTGCFIGAVEVREYIEWRSKHMYIHLHSCLGQGREDGGNTGTCADTVCTVQGKGPRVLTAQAWHTEARGASIDRGHGHGTTDAGARNVNAEHRGRGHRCSEEGQGGTTRRRCTMRRDGGAGAKARERRWQRCGGGDAKWRGRGAPAAVTMRRGAGVTEAPPARVWGEGGGWGHERRYPTCSLLRRGWYLVHENPRSCSC
ncbi:hypothetical protein DFH94DRAFT_846201 [Russula ochroleuca]|uniref:Uncharacterized protein n=1 Tax=Russula ochroleuca TaxID=152965 RepID=A0A9P5T793_9AGAM|nr:hypothetical protein DFH94DRAFT_846201 [Russula ochroleuca]